MNTTRVALLAALAALLSLGCNCSGLGRACETAEDCRGDLVCDPVSHTCQEGAGCTYHADCGVGAFCDVDGFCAPNGPGGPCNSSDNCVSGEICVSGTCEPIEETDGSIPPDGGILDAGCGGEFYTATNVPPNVLIVLDRSGSMDDHISGGTKWDIARDAVYDVITMYGDQIFFGLMLYPGEDQACHDGADCTAGPVQIDVGLGGGSAIESYLPDADTCNFGTPIHAALTYLLDYPGLQDPDRANYILLLTDGQETCGEDPSDAVEALRDELPEVKTFVVGFGSGVDPGELGEMATAGGTALPGSPSYYQADDAASLNSAFNSIAGNVLSCSYTLSSIPPDPDLLYVYFDGLGIARDTTHTDGWDYDFSTNQLTFYGAACDELSSGTVTDLVIVFGCALL